MTFGQRLRELRKAKGMTQRELAQRAGIDFTYLSKLETGAMPPPSEKTILSLAEVLDADADELFGAAGKVPSSLLQGVDSEMLKMLRSSRKEGKPPRHEQATLPRHIPGHEALRTKRTIEQGALKGWEGLYRAIVENTLDGILVLDGELNVIYESPSATSIFGYDPGEIGGKDALAVIHPDDATLVAYELTRLAQNPGETLCGEARVKHKDGTWRIIESSVINLLDDPVIRGILVNCRDITERRRQEEARVQHEAALATIVKYNLSDSEKNVLNLLLEGRSNHQIAEQLVTSPSTVKFHISNILRKLGATNRTEAVAVALRHQMITE